MTSTKPASIRREICDLLHRVGGQVLQNLGATYKIPRALGKLKKYKEQSRFLGDQNLLGQVTLIDSHLQSIWNAICSASSGYVPLDAQLSVVRWICEYMQQLSRALTDGARVPIEDLTGEFSLNYESMRREVHRVEPEASVQFDDNRLQALPEDRRNVILSIVESKALQYHNTPTFLLKSGFRSFYFFNGASLTHHGTSAKLFPRLIAKQVRDMLNKPGAPPMEGVALGFARRVTGETGGASSMAGSVAGELELPSVTLPPDIPEPFVGRIDGSSLEKDAKIVLIDDVIVTGASASSHLERFEREVGRTVYGYFTILDRRVGERPAPLKRIAFASGTTKEDLIRVKLWKPEILCISPESEMLSSIDLTCDYLREICVYCGRSEEDYENLRRDFIQIVDKSFNERLDNDDIKLNYLINLIMLTFFDLAPRFRDLWEEANE